MPTWRLNDVYREVTRLAQEGTSLQYKHRDGLTAYGNAAPLTTAQDPARTTLEGKTYVFRGGYVHETTDPAIRQLWLDSGFSVTEL